LNLETWADAAWADGSWVPESWGIGLAVEAGIGLAAAPRPPVDYVYADGWSPRFPGYSKVASLEEKRAVKKDNSELMEMMELYARWRKAA